MPKPPNKHWSWAGIAAAVAVVIAKLTNVLIRADVVMTVSFCICTTVPILSVDRPFGNRYPSELLLYRLLRLHENHKQSVPCMQQCFIN